MRGPPARPTIVPQTLVLSRAKSAHIAHDFREMTLPIGCILRAYRRGLCPFSTASSAIRHILFRPGHSVSVGRGPRSASSIGAAIRFTSARFPLSSSGRLLFCTRLLTQLAALAEGFQAQFSAKSNAVTFACDVLFEDFTVKLGAAFVVALCYENRQPSSLTSDTVAPFRLSGHSGFR
jgi:hypothetical protein